jgi:subtilisin family serine protease
MFDFLKSKFNFAKKEKIQLKTRTKQVEKKENFKNFLIEYGNFNKTDFKGSGEKVAVLDSGIDQDHIELKSKVMAKSFIKECKDPFDYCNHGTFIAGEIVGETVGLAPKAQCLSAKILHGDGRDQNLHQLEKNIYSAIKYSIEHDYGVISMSLGIPYKSKLIYKILQKAIENGIICVAAAGNEGISGSQFKSYPASFDNCISVGSANKYGLPSFYSTAGKGENKLEQPEVAIASLKYHYGIITNNRYGLMTGTSIACPVVAALALLWREKNRENEVVFKGKENIKQFREWLKENAQDTNNNGWDNELGFGVLRLKPFKSL